MKKKYADKITGNPAHSAAEGQRSIEQLAALFAEWCPIGKKLSDIQDIVGSPTIEYEGRPCYSFRCANPNGAGVEFLIRDSAVAGVLWIVGKD